MARITKRESEKNKKKTRFKNEVGIPYLPTFRTNNMVVLNYVRDENLNNNDNRVI